MTIRDPWVALQFDQAVVYFGVVIENALGERQTVGAGKDKRTAPLYTLKQLLRDDFQLPAPEREPETDAKPGGRSIVDFLRMMAGMTGGRGVKMLKGG